MESASEHLDKEGDGIHRKYQKMPKCKPDVNPERYELPYQIWLFIVHDTSLVMTEITNP